MLYVQIFLALGFMIRGILKFLGYDFMTTQEIKKFPPEPKRKYLRFEGLMDFLFGVLVIVFIIVDQMNIFSTGVYLSLYAAFIVVILVVECVICNKILRKFNL